MKRGAILVLSLLIIFISLIYALPLNISTAEISSTTGFNYSSDDLFAYVNGTTGSGSINYTLYWYKNNSVFFPINFQSTYDTEGSNYGQDLEIDSSGNIFILGSVAIGNDDSVLISYDSNGSYKWNYTFNTPSTESVRRFAIDRSGNSYVLASEYGNYDLANITKLNSTGNKILDITYTGFDYNYYIYNLDVSNSSNIYLSQRSNNKINIAKFNSTGDYNWNSTFNTNSSDLVGIIKADYQDNVYVAGYINGSYITQNVTLIKFNSTGDYNWNYTYGHSSGSSSINSLLTDTSGNVYAIGDVDLGLPNDVLIIKFNSSGQLVWNKTFSIGHVDIADDATFDPNGNLYITGVADYISYRGNILLVKINSTNGNMVWNASIDFGGHERGEGIGLSSNGEILVATSMTNNLYITSESNITLFSFRENSKMNSTSGLRVLVSNLSSIYTDYNDSWSFCVFASNNTASTQQFCSSPLIIFNSLIDRVYLNSTSIANHTSDDLIVYSEWSNINGSVNYSVSWYRNGNLYSIVNTTANSTYTNIGSLDDSSTLSGEYWSACVRGTDSANRVSEVKCTNNITILGTESTSSDSESSGSSSGGSVSCITTWICTEWSTCTDGIQNRNCEKEKSYCYIDLNSKPLENQSCENGLAENGLESDNSFSSKINNTSLKTIAIIASLVLILSIVYLLFRKNLFNFRSYRR